MRQRPYSLSYDHFPTPRHYIHTHSHTSASFQFQSRTLLTNLCLHPTPSLPPARPPDSLWLGPGRTAFTSPPGASVGADLSHPEVLGRQARPPTPVTVTAATEAFPNDWAGREDSARKWMSPNPFEARRLLAAQGFGSCWSHVILMRMLGEVSPTWRGAQGWMLRSDRGSHKEAVTQYSFDRDSPEMGLPTR